MSLIARMRRAARNARDRGASAVEYGLMVAAIAAVVVGTVFALGGFVKATFSKTCTAIASGASVAADPGCNDAPAAPATTTQPAAPAAT